MAINIDAVNDVLLSHISFPNVDMHVMQRRDPFIKRVFALLRDTSVYRMSKFEESSDVLKLWKQKDKLVIEK